MEGYRVEIVGDAVLVDYLRNATALGVRVWGEILLAEAATILRISQSIVPFRKGILKGSGGIAGPFMTPEGMEVQVGYGGAASAYAYIIHTGISRYGTPFSFRNGKQAFYLKKPFDEVIATMPARVAAHVEEVLHRV